MTSGEGDKGMDATSMDLLKRRFGERIRMLREMRGWQLEDLAERVEKSAATISRIENGKQNLTMVDILRIAQALEVAPSLLFSQDQGEISSEGLSTAKRSAQRCAKKSKQALQLLSTLVEDLEVFVSS
jgi:transcriptional regulator with XRE-family HTH domain